MFLGLRTVIYPAPDLQTSKQWFTEALGVEPYFDTDFYVGYSVGGFELALDPHADPDAGPVTYWGVADADAAFDALLAGGATERDPVTEVGDQIRTATLVLPHRAGILGIIENPHFLATDPPPSSDGPGK